MRALDKMYKKVVAYLANMCYSIVRIVRVILGGVGIMTKNKGIFDAKQLAGYIAHKYKKEKGVEISPIKLQKSLYFLFAYWGGIIRKSKENPDYVEEDLSSQNEILFDNDIEAWVYGPVVPDVYKAKDIEKYYSEGEDIFSGNKFLHETIDSILSDVFSIADFKLVSISHEDLCWQKKFDPKDLFHNNKINKEDIITEYATRECI